MATPTIIQPYTARTLAGMLPVFAALDRAYAGIWGAGCVLTDTDGGIYAGQAAARVQACAAEPACRMLRRQAIAEALRWGEPSIQLCPQGNILWAVPVMENAVLLGGLVTPCVEMGATDEGQSYSPVDIRRAAADLLAQANACNLTNAALMALCALDAAREAERAEAIHELKGQNYQSIRDLYLVEEPALISAIKQGARRAAREILNRILVAIYFMGNERPLLLKSFLLELVVTMSRSAVEAGGDPTELLGANYSSFAELARIETEEELCAWLVSMLERMMDAIKTNQHYPVSVLLGDALHYMREHLDEDLSRDDVARVACLSPSHFSRVVKQTFGQSFTDLLAKMRVDKARELLVRTEKSLIQICLACGFTDQSYFTKVFSKYSGRTPGEFRKQFRAIV